MTKSAPPRQGWRLFAAFALVVFASMLVLQEALARMLARWLAGVWVTTLDTLLRIFSGPISG
ncbi:MAG: hypothetical protein H7124_06150 [Phycisphaerales bacterium]|nr:hypothetical protein [Hyphomonadaceae bacterium]